ncbi:MAG TPA: hypothetical protein VFQ76_05920 [Longimicrobiaceae bacterium]|nr:hypothetical protein [Longimicrobiaceae bacterium]
MTVSDEQLDEIERLARVANGPDKCSSQHAWLELRDTLGPAEIIALIARVRQAEAALLRHGEGVSVLGAVMERGMKEAARLAVAENRIAELERERDAAKAEGRAEERDACANAVAAEAGKYNALPGSHGQRTALALYALKASIERGEHIDSAKGETDA